MPLNYPPLGYTGENVEGSNEAMTKPGIVRAATAAEAGDGTRDDVFISPATIPGFSAPVTVPGGGTGDTSLTDHGVMLGQGTDPVVVTAAGADGEVLLGATGADPAFAALASADGSITYTAGANTLDIAVTQATTSQLGGAQTATNDEAIAMTSTTVVLTPSNLAALPTVNSASTDITPTQSPILESNATTGAAPTGTTGAVNIMNTQGEFMEQFVMGAGQTIIAPRMSTSGLLVSLDLTDDEGAEYNWGARANAKHAYTIGTSAAFFLEWAFTAADVSGCDPVGIAFRKVEANNGTMESYTDFAFIGLSVTDGPNIWIKTRLNSGAVTNTDTTDTWVDGATHTLRINVSASGVVTYLIDGVAPSVTAAFTFDAGDVVMPFFELLHGTTAPGAINWGRFRAGLQ